MEQNMITIRNLSKEFKGQSVLKNITMEIPKNCVYGLLGANGAGKSTLLKTITGLLNPTSGEIYFEGHKWTRQVFSQIPQLMQAASSHSTMDAPLIPTSFSSAFKQLFWHPVTPNLNLCGSSLAK